MGAAQAGACGRLASNWGDNYRPAMPVNLTYDGAMVQSPEDWTSTMAGVPNLTVPW